MSEYREFLLSKEWKAKRKLILKRDKYICTICNNKKLFSKSIFGYITDVVKVSLGANVCIRILDKGEALIDDSFWVSDEDLFAILFVENHFRTYLSVKSPVLFKKTKDDSSDKKVSILALKTPSELDKKLIIDIIVAKRIDGVNSERCKVKIDDYKEAVMRSWDIVFGLHVHHLYYQLNKLPWEYKDDALITLCWHCHTELHENGSVPVFDESGRELEKLNYCQRCHGAGWFSEYEHVQDGICFRCEGARYEELIKVK